MNNKLYMEKGFIVGYFDEWGMDREAQITGFYFNWETIEPIEGKEWINNFTRKHSIDSIDSINSLI